MTTTTEKKQRAERFDPAIEPRWREFWERAGIFKAGRRQGAAGGHHRPFDHGGGRRHHGPQAHDLDAGA